MLYTTDQYFSTIFPGKVQKIAVNAGLGCPNRDGTVGSGGCIYCNNASFNPAYAHCGPRSITEQLEEGVKFFARKGEPYGYLPYFQSYTNTYGDTQELIELYEEALAFPKAVGLVIATRPDCLKEDLLDYFEARFGAKAPENHPFLLVEIGIESTNDRTLETIGRGHDFACAAMAVNELHIRGIAVGVHLILGLPGETYEDFMDHAERISELPVSTLKLHQLQVIKGSRLAQMFISDPSSIKTFSADEYASVVAGFLKHLRPGIALDRVVSESPRDMLLAPSWGLKPFEFEALLNSKLME